MVVLQQNLGHAVGIVQIAAGLEERFGVFLKFQRDGRSVLDELGGAHAEPAHFALRAENHDAVAGKIGIEAVLLLMAQTRYGAGAANLGDLRVDSVDVYRVVQRIAHGAAADFQPAVENAFLWLKRWKGIATRYAKNTTSFLLLFTSAVSLFGWLF